MVSRIFKDNEIKNFFLMHQGILICLSSMKKRRNNLLLFFPSLITQKKCHRMISEWSFPPSVRSL